MNYKVAKNLLFLAGVLYIISSIYNFFNNKPAMGIVYLCLSSAFISLGYINRKKLKAGKQ